MVKSCIYGDCNVSDRYSKDHKFIPFVKPWRDKNRCDEWLSLVGRPEFDVTKNTYICTAHFPEDTQVWDYKKNRDLRPFQVDLDRVRDRKQRGKIASKDPNEALLRWRDEHSDPLECNIACAVTATYSKADNYYQVPKRRKPVRRCFKMPPTEIESEKNVVKVFIKRTYSRKHRQRQDQQDSDPGSILKLSIKPDPDAL